MNVQIPTSSAAYYKDIDVKLQNCAMFSPGRPMPIQKRSNLASPKPFAPMEAAKLTPIAKGQKTRVEANNGEECICERAEGIVLCQRLVFECICDFVFRCGFELRGRLQRACPSHPKKICLMDHRECPSKFCRSVQLIEVALDDWLCHFKWT